MGILSRFYPDEYVDSVYSLDFMKYYDKGYRGILFDIDNTLVPHGAPSEKKAEELFVKLRQTGFKTCLISNNKEPRVKPFADRVKSDYIFNAHKPSGKNYIKAMETMGTNKDNSIFIGDQIFTDVYGAKKASMYTILTRPIHPKEEILIVLKRYLEKIVLYFYQRENNIK